MRAKFEQFFIVCFGLMAIPFLELLFVIHRMISWLQKHSPFTEEIFFVNGEFLRKKWFRKKTIQKPNT